MTKDLILLLDKSNFCERPYKFRVRIIENILPLN